MENTLVGALIFFNYSKGWLAALVYQFKPQGNKKTV